MHRKRKLRTGIGALAVLMVAAVLPIATATAQSADEAGMFSPVASSRAYAPPAEVVRSRTVEVDFATLFEADGRAKNKRTIGDVTFNLFPDITLIGDVTRTSQDAFMTAWSGDLVGVEDGYFHMVVADGAFAAHFASPAGIYEVEGSGDGNYRVVEIDQSKFVDHPPGAFDDPVIGDTITDAELRDLEASGRGVDSGDTLDIIVFYTPNAKIAEGGEANVRALVALALVETNASYQKSGVQPRLRLLHVEEAPYTEYDGGSGIFSTALNDLVNGTNGLAVAHTRRATYGADMVGMIIDDAQFCGLAAGILPGASLAFQVTDNGCATGYYSFGHEFGHLQGAHHDAYVASGQNWYKTYGYGWVNFPDRWRTVMAYNSECVSLGDNCTRLDRWSNPNRNIPALWGGDPTGGPSAKNWKVLIDSASTVANWRKSKGDDFYSGFTINARGWKEVVGNWAVNSKGWYWSKGKANMYSSVYKAGNYGDVTFEAQVKRTGVCTGCAAHLAIRGKATRVSPIGDWQPHYEFSYRNDGTFGVWKIKPNGNVIQLQGWTAHAAIKPGKWNKLKVVAVGNSLTFYINNQQVWTGTDNLMTIGHLGIGFYRDSSAGKLLINYATAAATATADAPIDIVFDEAEEIEVSPLEKAIGS